MPYADIEKRKAYNRAYSSTPEKRAQTQRWKDANRPSLRKYNLMRLYKITEEDYERMLADQGGTCAICHGPPGGNKGSNFCVDHDHITGSIRGLLCGHCNKGLGALKDDPALLDRAAAYLRSKGK